VDGDRDLDASGWRLAIQNSTIEDDETRHAASRGLSHGGHSGLVRPLGSSSGSWAAGAAMFSLVIADNEKLAALTSLLKLSPHPVLRCGGHRAELTRGQFRSA